MINDAQIEKMIEVLVKLVGNESKVEIAPDHPAITGVNNYLEILKDNRLKMRLSKEKKIFPTINFETDASNNVVGLKGNITIFSHNNVKKSIEKEEKEIIGEQIKKSKEVKAKATYSPDGFVYEPTAIVEKVIKLMAFEYPYNIQLVGPTGCGKTEMVRYMSYALADHFNKKFPKAKPVEHLQIEEIHGGAEVSTNYLLGTREAAGGTTFWKDGVVPKAMRVGLDDHGNEVGQPGVLLIDEASAIPPEIFIHLNGLLADTRKRRELTLPSGETVVSHSDFKVIVTGNTVGRGADGKEMIYTAQSNALDASTLGRFHATFDVDYNNDAEVHILKKCGLSDNDIETICKFRDGVRVMFQNDDVDIPFTTRNIKNIGLNFVAWGVLGEAVLYSCITPLKLDQRLKYNEAFKTACGIDLMRTYNIIKQ